LIEPETANTETAERRESQTSLKQLALLFFKLGVISFGGPAAHIAMMEDEVVRRRRWLSRDEFLDLLGATNLIPGPNSTEMAIHIGRRRAGWPGLLVAGSCFILPATLIVTALAWAYIRYGSLPQTDALLYGVKPVVIAIILQALWGLGRAALKTKTLALVGAVGIFLPAFFFVAVSGSLVPRIRRSVTAGAVLDGINAASLSLMAIVTWRLGRAALVDWTTFAMLVVSLILLIRFRINSAWLVPVGAVFGLVLSTVRGA